MHNKENIISFYNRRPRNAKGCIGFDDMVFVIEQICKNKPKLLVELGIASGVSSAGIIYANKLVKESSKNWECILYSFDINDKCYWDKSLEVGYAVKEMLESNWKLNWNLILNSSVIDFEKYFSKNSIDFLFIDANHRHPYPTLDLLFAFSYLKSNALVCIHDINLPNLGSTSSEYGANNLFYNIDLSKEIDRSSEIPNMGLLKIEKQQQPNLKQSILDIVFNYKWETNLMKSYLNKLEEEILKLYKH